VKSQVQVQEKTFFWEWGWEKTGKFGVTLILFVNSCPYRGFKTFFFPALDRGKERKILVIKKTGKL